jgi:selenocysteine lyase/cysteine desulfurase
MMAAPESMKDDIRKFEEIGTHPAALHNALAEALKFHEGIGVERKSARLRYLKDRWAKRLQGQKEVHLYTSLEPPSRVPWRWWALKESIQEVNHSSLGSTSNHRDRNRARRVQGIRVAPVPTQLLERLTSSARLWRK